MKKYLLVFVLLASPAFAGQQELLQSNIPYQDVYTVKPIPGTDQSIVQRSSTACAPPQQLLGKGQNILKTLKFNQPVRILPPNTFKTQDFNPRRVNFGVDERGIIRAISCG
jgi:hypothetical protein